MDEGFRHLLTVLEVLRAKRAGPAAILDDETIAGGLAFIPVLDPDPPFRRLRAPVVERGLERAEPWILARSEAARGSDLPTPPHDLGVDFLQDGVLMDDGTIRAAGYLGIRDYRVDTVLDALRSERVGTSTGADVTRFVWRFLRRDEQSSYSLPRAAEAIRNKFVPGRWFWSRPDVGDLTGRQEIRRAEALAQLMLPAAVGPPRPADELAFGADWAAWAEEQARLDGSHAYDDMARSYNSLTKLSPHGSGLIASPEKIRAFLGDPFIVDGDGAPFEISIDRLLHAFLVRIGVWEVPPVDSFNDRQSRSDDKRDPFVGREGRVDHLASLTATGRDFTAHDPLRVQIGEDYAFRWPLTGVADRMEALAHGIPLYRNCLSLRRYCSGCSAPGHGTKAPTRVIDDDPDRSSMLAWELETGSWVPVTLAGSAGDPVRPGEAWRDEEAAHPMQSSARFLRLIAASMPAELVAFAGIDDIQAASARRVGATLQWLHDQMPVLLGGAPRPTSDSGRAYLSLHRRLYDRLARLDKDEPGVAKAGTDATGVLVTRGDTLVFVDRAIARHDRGNFAIYRRQFGADVPFLAVKAEQSDIAKALRVDEFVVTVTREGDEPGIDVTYAIQEAVRDRIAYIMAALSYYPVGGTTLEVGGNRFRDRSQRLMALTVRQVPDLCLRISVDGKLKTRIVGEGMPDEIYVQDPTGPAPVVFHDFQDGGWTDRFLPIFASRLAEILENEAYASVIRLLVTAQTDDDAGSLLREFGVTDDQFDEVEGALESGDRMVRAAEKRWWDAVLPLLGISSGFDTGEGWRDRLRSALTTARPWPLPAVLADRLIAGASTDGMRRDVGEGSVLADLEAGGINLEKLHQRLVALGDGEPGLDVRADERRLEAWRKAHEVEVVAVLMRGGYAPASERPGLWRVPSSQSWRPVATPSIFLGPVVADLEAAGLIVPDVDALAGSDASNILAALVGMQPSELRTWWDSLSPANADELAASQVSGWRRLLRPIVVAARTQLGSSAFEIRENLARVDERLGAPESIAALAARLADLLMGDGTLSALLCDRVRNYSGFALPSVDEIAETAFAGGIDPGHLERVRQVILARLPIVADAVRRDFRELHQRGVVPVQVEPIAPPPPRSPPEGTEQDDPQDVGKVKHRPADTARIGRAGERWARAAVLKILMDLTRQERHSAVTEIEKVLKRFRGPAIPPLLQAAIDFRSALDEDHEIEALARLVHVSAVSDAFGFDLLGYIPDERGSHRVLLLEVKATGGNSFFVSDHEWRVAQRPATADIYAFVTIGRTKAGAPQSMRIFVNPCALMIEGRLTLEPEEWTVKYALPHRPADGTCQPAAEGRRGSVSLVHALSTTGSEQSGCRRALRARRPEQP